MGDAEMSSVKHQDFDLNKCSLVCNELANGKLRKVVVDGISTRWRLEQTSMKVDRIMELTGETGCVDVCLESEQTLIQPRENVEWHEPVFLEDCNLVESLGSCRRENLRFNVEVDSLLVHMVSDRGFGGGLDNVQVPELCQCDLTEFRIVDLELAIDIDCVGGVELAKKLLHSDETTLFVRTGLLGVNESFVGHDVMLLHNSGYGLSQ